MKIFVAGATGALGRRLVPRLVANGHTVVGTTRTPSKAEALRADGATPMVLDALDRDAVIDALARAEPEVVVHQLTALTGFTDFRKLDESFAATNRLRTEATDHLLEGIRRLPLRRIVAQSYAAPGFYARTGGPVKTEDDPFDPDPPAALRRPVDAVRARAPRPARAASSSRPSGAASSRSSRQAGRPEPRSGLLHGVVRLAQPAKHPIGDARRWPRWVSNRSAGRSWSLIGHRSPSRSGMVVRDDPEPGRRGDWPDHLQLPPRGSPG